MDLKDGRCYEYEGDDRESLLINWINAHPNYKPLVLTVKEPQFCREDHELDQRYTIKQLCVENDAENGDTVCFSDSTKILNAIEEFHGWDPKAKQYANTDQKHMVVFGKGALAYIKSKIGYPSTLAFMQNRGRASGKSRKTILAANINPKAFDEKDYITLRDTVPLYQAEV